MPQWFRFYSETTTDRKIDRICRATGQPKMVIVGAWVVALSLANDSPVRGALLLTEDHPFTLADLAAELGTSEDVAQAIIDQFVSFRMMHLEGNVYWITNWGKRQFASDDSGERVRRFRERRVAERNGDETLRGRDSSAPEQSRDRAETDNRTETESEADAGTVPAAVAVAGPSRDPLAIRKRLADCGIGPPKLDELTAAAWVTIPYIDSWERYVNTWTKADRDVRISSMIKRMETRRQVPEEYRT